MSENSIIVYVEGDGEGVILEFNGPDAEARHAQWALNDVPVYDRAYPAPPDTECGGQSFSDPG